VSVHVNSAGMRSRDSVLIAAMTLLDVCVLLGDRPRWRVLASGFAAPHVWISRVGADSAAVSVAAAVLWLAAVWLAIGLLATAGSHAPGVLGSLCGRVSRTALPAVMRRICAGAAGISVVLSPVAACATSGHGAVAAVHPDVRWPADRVIETATDRALAATIAETGGNASRSDIPPAPAVRWPSALPQGAAADPLPGAPPGIPPRGQPPAAASSATLKAVTVNAGDSLWTISARALGPHASAADICAAWPRWYAANRRVIGNDPALLIPGTRLIAPATNGYNP
jgi:hypothetical protein